MYYGDSGKIILVVFATILLVFAGIYWHETLFILRFLADLLLLNLPPHLQAWMRAFFHIHSAS